MKKEVWSKTHGKCLIIVDDEDSHHLKHRWSVTKLRNTLYALRWTGEQFVYLHRVIMDPESNQKVDHVDGNGLNNRRSNLRICSNGENLQNRGPQKNNKSGFKGVCFDKSKGCWRAEIATNKKRKSLGRFHTAEEAAKAYDKAAKQYHGPFAYQNFPEELEP